MVQRSEENKKEKPAKKLKLSRLMEEKPNTTDDIHNSILREKARRNYLDSKRKKRMQRKPENKEQEDGT